MFWHASVHPWFCLSTGGVPISHNALQHFPECHEAAGRVPGPPQGGYPGQVPPWGGTWSGTPGGGGVPGSGTPPGGVPSQVPPGGYLGQVPPRGVPKSGTPPRGGGTRVRYPPGGYPARTTEGVLTTRRAVCLLRSRRRTFLLFVFRINWQLNAAKISTCYSFNFKR